MNKEREFRKIGSTKRLYDGLYRLIADLWCSPRDVNLPTLYEDLRVIIDSVRREKDSIMSEDLYLKWEDVVHYLEKFLAVPPLSEAEYIEMFELDPKCPLYLGYHNYDEPTTCHTAATSQRNEYMIELKAIYRHFGLILGKPEMPDYLPLMIEFLALTLDKRYDPIRVKFIDEYFLPYLPPMKDTLKKLNSSYHHLISALEKLLEWENEFLEYKNNKDYVG